MNEREAGRGKGWGGAQREVVSTKLVCEHNGRLGCELGTSISCVCIRDHWQ